MFFIIEVCPHYQIKMTDFNCMSTCQEIEKSLSFYVHIYIFYIVFFCIQYKTDLFGPWMGP